MVIIYHSRDLDGFTSGAILKKKFPSATLIGYDYGQPIPEGLVGEDVIMVDVTFKPDIMHRIAEQCKSFLVIDHHISFIKELREYQSRVRMPDQFSVFVDDQYSACELAWMWCFTGTEMPMAVALIGAYDTWKNSDPHYWENKTLPFQYGMRMICTSPEKFPVSLFDDNTPEGRWPIQVIVDKGKVILEYQQMVDIRSMKSAFEFVWKGHRILACNGAGFSSQTFKSKYDPSKHDIMMPFQFNGTFWTFSLYTEKDIDCSAIAISLGGGGHKKAAGFQVGIGGTMPFPL